MVYILHDIVLKSILILGCLFCATPMFHSLNCKECMYNVYMYDHNITYDILILVHSAYPCVYRLLQSENTSSSRRRDGDGRKSRDVYLIQQMGHNL